MSEYDLFKIFTKSYVRDNSYFGRRQKPSASTENIKLRWLDNECEVDDDAARDVDHVDDSDAGVDVDGDEDGGVDDAVDDVAVADGDEADGDITSITVNCNSCNNVINTTSLIISSINASITSNVNTTVCTLVN